MNHAIEDVFQKIGFGTDQSVPARWSETIALLAGLGEEPAILLRALSVSNPELAMRAIASTERLALEDAVELLLDIDESSGCDFLTLLHLRRSSGSTEACITTVLWQFVHPRRSPERLGWLYFALECFGPIDRMGFFKTIGKPVPTVSEFFVDVADIPSGTFVMGDSAGDGEENELPIRSFVMQGFGLMNTPVTVDQYRRFAGTERFQSQDEDSSKPITDVCWWEAYLYAKWLGGRLPTECEWEYACRAGTSGPFWCSDGQVVDVQDVGWFLENSGGILHGVARKKQNPWGLFDMHGNVWEWCADRYCAYGVTPEERFTSSGVVSLNGGMQERVIRGGCYLYFQDSARSSTRLMSSPDARLELIGFRVAFDLSTDMPRRM
jgi:hypothetical protein